MDEIKIVFEEIEDIKLEDTREVVAVEKPVYPELEDLTIKPTTEEQKFKSNKYGYNNITVEAIQGKSLEVTPTIEEQIFSDLYTNVKVQGDENLLASNIKQGINIFGVNGKFEGVEYWNEEKPSGVGVNNFKVSLFLKKLPTKINLTYASSLSGAFDSFYILEEIDLSKWEFSETIKNLSRMFSSCNELVKLDIGNLKTTNVTDMNYMFYGCGKLTSLDLSNFETSNVTNMSYMFSYCKNLKMLDIRNFTFDKVTSYSGMFGDASYNQVPSDCLIIVKGETEKQWVLARRSNLTNVKTVAELG